MGSSKKLNFLLIGSLAVLLIFLYWLTVWPRIMDMKETADEATKKKNVAVAQLAAAKELDEDVIALDLERLRQRVPSSLELPNLIIKLDELATVSELTWTGGTPEDITVRAAQDATATANPDEAPELLERYDLSITLEGEIDNLIKFIFGMTDISIGRVVVIESLDLQFNSDENSNFVEVSLKLQVIGWVDGASIDSLGCIQDQLEGVGSIEQNENCVLPNPELEQ